LFLYFVLDSIDQLTIMILEEQPRSM